MDVKVPPFTRTSWKGNGEVGSESKGLGPGDDSDSSLASIISGCCSVNALLSVTAGSSLVVVQPCFDEYLPVWQCIGLAPSCP
jgi:hypothetical protein